MPSLPRLILASQSPRRKDLLSATGLDFTIVVRTADEIQDASMEPGQLCLFNARLKADAVAREYPDATVIGADTLVFLNRQPLGKPCNKEDAARMLRMLSGKFHSVCTGVCLRSPLGNVDLPVVTNVKFRKLSPETIDHYLELVHVLDKAGAYAFQEHGDMIIESVDGDANNVIGLPVGALMEQLKTWGYSPLHP